MSDYGDFTTGAGGDLAPAWNELGSGLLDVANLDPNGVTIRTEGFGTIFPYGDILLTQWVLQQQTATAIESLQSELEELIEVYWTENYPDLTADNTLVDGTTTITVDVPHDNTTTYDADYSGISVDQTEYRADNTKD